MMLDYNSTPPAFFEEKWIARFRLWVISDESLLMLQNQAGENRYTRLMASRPIRDTAVPETGPHQRSSTSHPVQVCARSVSTGTTSDALFPGFE